MIELVIVTHGNLGEVLYQTVTMIMGEQEKCTCFSSGNLVPVDLYEKINKEISEESAKENGVIIAVDLKGGNTWNIACKLSHQHSHVRVVSGINVGVLISFFTKRQTYDLNKLLDVLVEDGHRHIDQYCPKF